MIRLLLLRKVILLLLQQLQQLLLPLLLLGSFTLGVSYLTSPAAGFGAGLITAWIILSLAYLGAARGFLQRFRTRPHAFLLP